MQLLKEEQTPFDEQTDELSELTPKHVVKLHKDPAQLLKQLQVSAEIQVPCPLHTADEFEATLLQVVN